MATKSEKLRAAAELLHEAHCLMQEALYPDHHELCSEFQCDIEDMARNLIEMADELDSKKSAMTDAELVKHLAGKIAAWKQGEISFYDAMVEIEDLLAK